MTHALLIDYLAYTVKEALPEKGLKLLGLSLDLFSLLDRGGLGYKKRYIFSSISIFFDGAQDMGCHYQVSGKGCRYLEAQGLDLWALAQEAFSSGFTLTRIDLALDIREDLLSPVLESIEKDLYVSRFKSVRLYSAKDGRTQMTPQTVYIGSRSSQVMLRIYDKKAEQGLPARDPPWTRIEVETKKKAIPGLLALLKEDRARAFFSVLQTYFRPVKYREKCVTRSPTAPYWEALVGHPERVSLFEKPEEPSLDEKLAWIRKQVAPTLAQLSLAFENVDWIGPFVMGEAHRLSEKDLETVRRFKEGIL